MQTQLEDSNFIYRALYSDIYTPKLVRRLPTPRAIKRTSFKVKRSPG